MRWADIWIPAMCTSTIHTAEKRNCLGPICRSELMNRKASSFRVDEFVRSNVGEPQCQHIFITPRGINVGIIETCIELQRHFSIIAVTKLHGHLQSTRSLILWIEGKKKDRLWQLPSRQTVSLPLQFSLWTGDWKYFWMGDFLVVFKHDFKTLFLLIFPMMMMLMICRPAATDL